MLRLRETTLGIGAVGVFAAGVWVGIGSAGGTSVAASPVGLRASLSAAQEVPKAKGVPAAARGQFVATLVRKGTGGTLSWRLTFGGLSGKGIAAHVHLGKPGQSGSVAVPLCGPCRSGARGSASANAKTVSAMLAGAAYVNVHTAKNVAGEIRGQIRRGAVVLAPPATTTTSTSTSSYTYTTPTDPY